jgi:hypothetical protein
VNSGNFELAKKELNTIESTLGSLKRSRGFMEYDPIWEAAYERVIAECIFGPRAMA